MIDIDKFRKLYPQFDEFDDELIKLIEEQAMCFLNECNKCNELLLMLMVAHLLQIRKNAESGNATGTVTSATIDKVSVSYSVPSSSSDNTAWFNLTPFGQQLLQLIGRCSGGGIYVGGRPELAAFRGVGGRIKNRGRSY